jgi:hypothetical protein
MTKFIRQAPAYQIYPSNIMSNINWRTMSLEQRGLMITLQFECWVNGSVPSNPSILAKVILCRNGNLKDLMTKELMSFFMEEDGKIVCPELNAYKNELDERRKKQSIGGKKGQLIKKNKQLDDEEFENYPKTRIEGQLIGEPSRYPEGSLEENKIVECSLAQPLPKESNQEEEDLKDEFIQTINSTNRYM